MVLNFINPELTQRNGVIYFQVVMVAIISVSYKVECAVRMPCGHGFEQQRARLVAKSPAQYVKGSEAVKDSELR